MGIMDFVRDAGEAIFGANKAEAATADPEALKKEIEKHGLNGKGLDITVNGDTVKVSGQVASREEAEKIVLALGNTQGVAKVDDQLTTTAESPKAAMYTVKSGDTLSKIAEAHYGKGKSGMYTKIFEANKPMLKSPDKIYPGQVLRIPSA